MYKLIIWQKSDNSLYYKRIKGYKPDYVIGYENGYGHKIVFVIDITDIYRKLHKPIRNRIIESLIYLLDKLKK